MPIDLFIQPDCWTVIVLLIYCCITHYSKTQGLKTTNIYYHIVSGSGHQKCFYLLVLVQHLTGLRSRWQLGLQSSKQVGEYISKMAHSYGSLQQPQFLADLQREASVLHHVGLSVELLDCPYNMVTSFLQSQCSKRQNQEEAQAF